MPQYMTGRPRSTRSQLNIGNQKLLRAATPEELEQWSDASSDSSYFTDELTDLDESRPYTFEVRILLLTSEQLSLNLPRVCREASQPGFAQQTEPGVSAL